MIVGVARITVGLPAARSLKDKRRVLQSLLQRVRNEFAVAAAEVDDQGAWTRATIGVACVSNDRRHADRWISKVVDYVERDREAVLMDVDVETR
ncbi:MAG: DUF503 domain-containing protein [Armatimonadetes bacterium]|nr:DUF503 domain-containing protein [Armatimonadota bacterium]